MTFLEKEVSIEEVSMEYLDYRIYVCQDLRAESRECVNAVRKILKCGSRKSMALPGWSRNGLLTAHISAKYYYIILNISTY